MDKEMNKVSEFFHFMQDRNPEKYDESVMTLKERDDALSTLTDACKSLEVINGIEFLGAGIVDKKTLYKFTDKTTEIDFEDSRTVNYEIKFKLSCNGEEKIVKKVIAFPKLVDGTYYIINGIRYYPILQLVDAETYRTNKSVTMRTSLQPIMIYRQRISVEDLFGAELSNIYCFSKIFSIKTPIFIYYFSNFGVFNTIKYFNLPFEIFEESGKLDQDDFEDYLVFKLGKKFGDSQLYLKVPYSWLDEDEEPEHINHEILLLTFLNAFANKDKIPYEKLGDKGYWVKKLGSFFTKNTSNWYNKGESVKRSFERLFDNTTKKMIRIDENDKKDIYTLIRWFLINYNHLLKMNNNDLANKRLRLNETFIYPLQEHWTTGVLRILNAKKVTLANLEKLFSTIKIDFLIKKNINNADANKNLRYSNLVNTLDAGIKLKVTSSGPQSISNSNGEIKGKDLDISMLGNLDIIYTSAGNPGETRMLTPTAHITDSWHFSDEPNIIANTFGDEEFDFDEDEDEDIEYNDEFESKFDDIELI